MISKLFYRGPSLADLHENYARRSRIDEAAPAACSVSTVIGAPPDRVWAVLSDVAGWPGWYPGMQDLELDGVRPGGRLRWRTGGGRGAEGPPPRAAAPGAPGPPLLPSARRGRQAGFGVAPLCRTVALY